ncbi:SDR family NAD(P)-dependent oxidoreductase [Streptomyces sp. NPDC003863]
MTGSSSCGPAESACRRPATGPLVASPDHCAADRSRCSNGASHLIAQFSNRRTWKRPSSGHVLRSTTTRPQTSSPHTAPAEATNAVPLTTDLRDAEVVHALCHQAHHRLDPIDVLVSNAGAHPRRPWTETTPAHWGDAPATSLTSHYRLVHEPAPRHGSHWLKPDHRHRLRPRHGGQS